MGTSRRPGTSKSSSTWPPGCGPRTPRSRPARPRSSSRSAAPRPGTTSPSPRTASCRSPRWPTATSRTDSPEAGPTATSWNASPWTWPGTRTTPPATPPAAGPGCGTTSAPTASPTPNCSPRAWPPPPATDASSTGSATVSCSPSPIPPPARSSGSSAAPIPPSTDPDRAGPKYLNTPETVLFHKGAQLFGHIGALLDAGAIPVRVEGPTDAIAVTLATDGRYLGLAPLGTALTEQQAGQLARLPRAHDLIIATDGDLAGHLAGERDFWLLTPHGLDPHLAAIPAGSDPADILTRRGPQALRTALTTTRPLGDLLLQERLTDLPDPQNLHEAAAVLAARPAPCWDAGTDTITTRLDQPAPAVRRALRDAARDWSRDRRGVAAARIAFLRDVRVRLEHRTAGPTPAPVPSAPPARSERQPRPRPPRRPGPDRAALRGVLTVNAPKEQQPAEAGCRAVPRGDGGVLPVYYGSVAASLEAATAAGLPG